MLWDKSRHFTDNTLKWFMHYEDKGLILVMPLPNRFICSFGCVDTRLRNEGYTFCSTFMNYYVLPFIDLDC